MPDETNLSTGQTEVVRPLVPPRDDTLPLYVQHRGAQLGRSGDEIVVLVGRAEVGRARLEDTSEVVLLGNISATAPLLSALSERDIPVAWHSYGGWYYGSFVPASGRGALARVAQHRAAADPTHSLRIAQSLVHAKIRNQRTVLRRNGRDVPPAVLERLRHLARRSLAVDDKAALLGVEGSAAKLYFEHLSRMLRADVGPAFDMNGRNRRPPRDPINALLSFVYAMLSREWTHVLTRIGLDPYVGFLHEPRHARPALALDMMEPFRPVVADSVVIGVVNNGVVQPDDFLVHPAKTTRSSSTPSRAPRTASPTLVAEYQAQRRCRSCCLDRQTRNAPDRPRGIAGI